MCFPPDAVPPVPPIRGAAVDHEDLVLTAADGNRFAAFEATTRAATAGIIVLPDVRGLFRFYEELALRFAEHGYDAVAIDYFGRTAGIAKRDHEWDYWPHVDRVTQDGLKADVAAAADRLRSHDPARAVFTIGFCFGGSNSWHQAANGHGLSGAIGFYGNPGADDWPSGARSVTARVGEMQCPLLVLMAGLDLKIMAEVPAFEGALHDAGVEYELVTYPDAPHSFFDRTYEEHAADSADAWRRVLAFITANSR